MRFLKPHLIACLSIFLTCFTLTAQSTGEVQKSLVFNSSYLNGTVNYSVYLPPTYSDNTVKEYNLLYLLHGYDGNENSWLTRINFQFIIDSLLKTGSIQETIIVMPDGSNSYYINNYNNEVMYEDFFIKEFMPYIESQYKINKNKKPAICGFSMGGFGVVVLAIKNPKLFSTTVTLSGALRTPEIFMSMSQQRYNKYFGEIFGNDLTASERITVHWKENSPYYIINSNNVENFKHINWYIDCGMQDLLLPSNKAFHELLLKHKINHEFHMRVGGHNWKYWRTGLIHALQYINTTDK